VAGAVLALVRRRNREVTFLVVSAALYLLLMAVNHWETRYYFYLMVCYVGLASYFIVEAVRWLSQKWALSQRLAMVTLLVIGLSIASALSLRAYNRVAGAVRGQPYELLGARDYLKGVGSPGTRMMARKPHLAYLSHVEWVFFPAVKSLEELRATLEQDPAEYMVYDRISVKARPELKVLANPENGISWLKPVYADVPRSFVLYRIELPRG
jgi:hypothetical protein